MFKKKFKNAVSIPIPVYCDNPIVFLFTDNIRDNVEFLQSLDLSSVPEGYVECVKRFNLDANIIGYTVTNSKFVSTVVRMNSIPNTNKEYNYLHHEILHACMHFLDNMGIRCSPKNDEPLAYLIGYVTEKVYDWIDNNS